MSTPREMPEMTLNLVTISDILGKTVDSEPILYVSGPVLSVML